MPQQIYFNKAANRQRVDIEHGIGCLKNRFRQSFFLKLGDIKLLCHLIRSCMYGTST